jgi:outer membrane biosynthesis protein TonB
VADKQKLQSEEVYTFVEQMPELPGGGGTQAVANELMRTLQVPKLKEQLSWPRTRVSFIVGPDGRIYGEQVLLIESIPEYKNAMLSAIQALPMFKPGYQEGKPVAVRLTLPFSCIMVQ